MSDHEPAMLHRAFVLIATVALALAAATGEAATPPADPAPPPARHSEPTSQPAPRCRIGKPSYCLKYGGGIHCEAKTTLTDKKAACAAWVAGCFDCHQAISECLGGRRIDAKTLMCTTCADQFTKCLYANDAKFWPTRIKTGD